jgi:hypothetical protein
MTVPPGPRIDIREEIDLLSIDPLFLERQRNRYASRGVGLVVLLNGIAAIALLVGVAHGTSTTESTERFADAMMVFGAGAVLGLATAFFAYLSRTFRMERPPNASWRMPLRWLAVGAAMLGAACFLTGLNMARIAVHHTEVSAGTPSAGNSQSSPSSPATKP